MNEVQLPFVHAVRALLFKRAGARRCTRPIPCAQIVVQQLDMHPIRGAWNTQQKRFLQCASPDEPLAFLDFIEDAALAIPSSCRRKLPRCLQVPERAQSELFKKPPAGVCSWPQ